MKAIQLVNEQGQKIYTINKENYEAIIPQLQLAPDAIADIQGAAQAGLTVTTHQKRISINGYTGEGYIILNERGTGAYLINGGLYGGALQVAGVLSSMMLVSIGVRNTLAKILAGLKVIPAFGNMGNFLILSALILEAVDIFLACKAAASMISGMMFMSAIILGLSNIISLAVNPLVGYIMSVGTISILKASIDTANCRKP